MTRLSRPILARTAVAAAILIICAVSTASAQFQPGPGSPWPDIGAPIGGPNAAVGGDMPGLTDPGAPLVFPPIFRAEARLRPIYWQIWGNVTEAATGRRLDFQQDLDMIDTGLTLEPMVRFQVGRISLRAHSDIYLRNFSGPDGRLEIPMVRFGADFDLIQTPTLRIGVNTDYKHMSPYFRLTADSPFGARTLNSSRPLTAGCHIDYNPLEYGGVTGSFSARGRLSFRKAIVLNQYEVAAGLRTPETVLGTVALRGGWRYTTVDFDSGLYEVRSSISGYFGEIVYFY